MAALIPLSSQGASELRGAGAASDIEAPSSEVPSVSAGLDPSGPASISGLRLPEPFVQRVRQRALLDEYAARFHSVETELESVPFQPESRFRPLAKSVRVIGAKLSDEILHYRQAMAEHQVPVRGFRAPLLDDAADLRSPSLPAVMTERQARAAELVRHHLASDGLLQTLARMLEALGAEYRALNPAGQVRALCDLGFPVDLLEFFQLEAANASGTEPIIAHLLSQIEKGRSGEDLAAELQRARFVFAPALPTFRAAAENGEYEIGLLRVQVGGGYRNGLVHGGSIDVVGQLIAAMPEADVVASVPEPYLENIHWLAQHCWPLQRAGRLALISEKLPVTPWSQDNGKAGYLAGDTRDFGAPATLVPRYASQQEATSAFYPGESFLADGLRAAGHTVIQSPLLFQGGNLIVVHDPRRQRRVLLLAETEVYRNTNLGLTRAQVLEAFQIEFAVDQCVVLPAVSYHLDYDVTLRVHGGEVLAFVNDPTAAARLIVLRVIEALEAAGVMPSNSAQSAAAQFNQGQENAVLRSVIGRLGQYQNPQRAWRNELARWFNTSPMDSPSLNLRCFLAALDVLGSRTLVGDQAPSDPVDRKYFEAHRALETTASQQQDQLRQLGWKIIPVPSMPDLYASLNYLNGLQDATRYVMPVFDGFYRSVDDAAAQAIEQALEGQIKVVRIPTSDLQMRHGGVHCAASAYPRLKSRPEEQARSGSTPSS